MADNYKASSYVESSYLAGGWRYRILRVVKNTGEVAFMGFLSYKAAGSEGEVRFICLREYDSIDQAREAVYERLPSNVLALVSMMKHPPVHPQEVSDEVFT
jgi:hypothetical protein